MKKTSLVVLAGIVVSFFSVAAQSELIRITPEGVSVSEQTITSPVPITADGFRLTYHGGGSKTLLDPLFVIFATPDGATPVLSVSGPSDPTNLTASIELGGANLYGGFWDTATGFAGTYDQNTSKDSTGGNISVYEFIGFDPGGSSSQNYPNWNGTSGIDSWDLWVYGISFEPDLTRGDWLEFSTSNLAEGSFVVGYGCTSLDSNSDCKNNAAAESTPFTFAGYVTTEVPEPLSIALVGIGLLGLAIVRIKTAGG